MYTKAVVIGARSLLATTTAACSLLAGTAAAGNLNVTVALRVSAQGLDLSQPADAQKFYTRLKRAAWVVCTHGNRVDLVPSDDPAGCSEKAIAAAIHSANVPLLTQIYVANHTPQAAASWTYVLEPVAAK
jgi:UrcA family protein